ncbi:uncharacterized protein BO88DRAFT_408698 [Aspergillus vadensis CBS 113365]|uniref:Uncharacterized protein n=1 Tax=Aspergillus vadensis (strain CBS 113365 / IMI 142717 / IBT 24658) TaxID=1448311 RepID=A0A319AWC9_ASPVC|nr:hypothetical protein BO88DRAFT_408698 [Aspergillus vadensis CBS 113365]PYH64035.1 hypothetical protein BO88DRAFT_408698 [Aspergillus vadensis CBS 113365]
MKEEAYISPVGHISPAASDKLREGGKFASVNRKPQDSPEEYHTITFDLPVKPHNLNELVLGATA